MFYPGFFKIPPSILVAAGQHRRQGRAWLRSESRQMFFLSISLSEPSYWDLCEGEQLRDFTSVNPVGPIIIELLFLPQFLPSVFSLVCWSHCCWLAMAGWLGYVECRNISHPECSWGRDDWTTDWDIFFYTQFVQDFKHHFGARHCMKFCFET